MTHKQKLELTWIGKGDEPKLEPRISLWDKDKSYGDENTENMLIHGDNLMALKALEQDYAGRIKCIYIDPPYNTGSAFEHYDDNLEHSIWLGLMKPRLEILHKLLSEDGFIFVQIDNTEMAYLKILLDEVFGRKNFINDIIWKRKGGSVNPRNKLNNMTDYILWYSKSSAAAVKPVYTLDDEDTKAYIEKRFRNVDEHGRRYRLSPIISPTYSATLVYDYKGYTPPPNGWSFSRTTMERFEREGRLYFPASKNQRIQRKQFLDEYKGRPIGNLWTDINVINPMSSERLEFVGQKPERLIERVLTLGSNPGDLVLDSFLGSGTTAAVAHKMNRRWIGIELGDHCYTHCKPRLEKVIDGEQGGISKAVGWQGGGGFKFYELAPSLLKQDTYGNWVIDKEHYNPEMLAAAVAKLNGYRYEPNETIFWKQGKSHENSYIFVTTQFITAKYLDLLAADMQYQENLLICCPAYDTGLNNRYENIIIKKIPQAVLDKCEFGVKDYNINLKGVTGMEGEEDTDE
ncbi:MAG: site-specific DNA-methyltransferase [Desulfitobacteriaceae bacterium]|nr:site-specific DNA-methyltransferase [Desulfitobacteriaceae bacterium]